MEIKFSVIIPCYNVSTTILSTLQSLECQTFREFEVLCIDDGSTDETARIINDYCAGGIVLDLRLIQKPNGGVSSARNIGICQAHGKYLLFLDADDRYHPSLLEKFNSAIANNCVDTVYCKSTHDPRVLSQECHLVGERQNIDVTMSKLLYEMGNYSFCCFLYKKEILDEFHIQFNEKTRRFEDREFNWKYLCHCKTAWWIDYPLYYYFVNPRSVTNSTVQWSTDGFEAVKRIEEYLYNYKISFYDKLKDYLMARVVWSRAKNYSIGRRKDLFKKLAKYLPMKVYMKRMTKDPNGKVRIAARLYLFHPMLFYYIIGMHKN